MPQGDSEPLTPSWVFREGDSALLIDRKGRRHLLELHAGKVFHTHFGMLPHEELFGQESGCRVKVGSQRVLALKPTLAEYVVEAPRVTQIIYPKDIGAILLSGDVFPGARVLEGGLGSGSLTLALIAAVGPQGRVTVYELHPETVEKALRNLRRRGPLPEHLDVRVADVYQGIAEGGLDRILLDVPEPWQVVAHAAEALAPGGIFLSFLPTVLQVHRLGEALTQHPQFDLVETIEVIVRPWHVSRRSVRPVHRMVAHTGFITTARKCAPGKLPRLEDLDRTEREPNAYNAASKSLAEGGGQHETGGGHG
ncbi:MAG: tRNA (adenine-N1)-methyltransferase [Dehalococcoidia bacterium]|nr:tRNA (adenine-N1)-methyltransferase [Dehalococcoidia bacterium]